MFIYWSLYGKLTVLITSVNDICSIYSIYNTHVRGQINVHLTKNFLSFFSVKDIRAKNKSCNPDSGRFTDSFFLLISQFTESFHHSSVRTFAISLFPSNLKCGRNILSTINRIK